MTSFVLIPGAGGTAWYWHRVVPMLQAAGYEAIAVDLPGPDEKAGLDVYAEIVVKALENQKDVILIAQSLGAFTAPLVCERVPVRMLILANPMIPLPGETAGEWWGNTKSHEAQAAAAKRGGYSGEFDQFTYFLHDVPPDIIKDGASHQRSEADIIFKQPCLFTAWPPLPLLHVITGSGDRFFPPEFQARIARERLGKDIDIVRGGHLNALSYPQDFVERVLSYLS